MAVGQVRCFVGNKACGLFWKAGDKTTGWIKVLSVKSSYCSFVYCSSSDEWAARERHQTSCRCSSSSALQAGNKSYRVKLYVNQNILLSIFEVEICKKLIKNLNVFFVFSWLNLDMSYWTKDKEHTFKTGISSNISGLLCEIIDILFLVCWPLKAL